MNPKSKHIDAWLKLAEQVMASNHSRQAKRELLAWTAGECFGLAVGTDDPELARYAYDADNKITDMCATLPREDAEKPS